VTILTGASSEEATLPASSWSMPARVNAQGQPQQLRRDAGTTSSAILWSASPPPIRRSHHGGRHFVGIEAAVLLEQRWRHVLRRIRFHGLRGTSPSAPRWIWAQQWSKLAGRRFRSWAQPHGPTDGPPPAAFAAIDGSRTLLPGPPNPSTMRRRPTGCCVRRRAPINAYGSTRTRTRAASGVFPKNLIVEFTHQRPLLPMPSRVWTPVSGLVTALTRGCLRDPQSTPMARSQAIRTTA